MYGVRNSSWNPTLFDFPNKNSDLKMKEREILSRRGLMKSHIQTHALCLMSLSLSVPLFYFLSVFAMCVYLLFFFVFLPSFFSLPFFLCMTFFIYREIPKKLFPYFLSTDQLMEQFALVFLSTTPNFVFSRAPLFPLFK